MGLTYQKGCAMARNELTKSAIEIAALVRRKAVERTDKELAECIGIDPSTLCRFKPIKLSTTNGTIKVNINKVTFVVGNALTDGVDWERANWDLQTISRDGVVKTLVGGEIKLIHDITRGD